MSATVTWQGLDELRAALRQLPATLRDEAQIIVTQTADEAMAAMRAEYPAGELRDRLGKSSINGGLFGVAIQIKNRSGWAWAWDFGTKLRHRITSGGSTGAEWGGKTAPHTFVRNMDQYRRRMYDALKALLTREGLTVTGEP